MLEIQGGRYEFYQWDINQYLLVDNPDIKEVHFSNVYEKKALVVEVVEGKAAVPNILLQTATYIYAYAFCGECVRAEAAYRVKQRKKPADYVYTETEIKRYEDLEQRIANLEKGGSADIDLSDYYTKEETNTAIQENKYTLPAASADTLGGVKVGDGLQMDGEVLGVVPENGELIKSLLIEDEEVLEISIDKDNNDIDFALKQLDVFVYIPANTKAGSINYIAYDKKRYRATAATIAAIKTSNNHIRIGTAKKGGKYLTWHRALTNEALRENCDIHATATDDISIVSLQAHAPDACFPAGTAVELWGVRA